MNKMPTEQLIVKGILALTGVTVILLGMFAVMGKTLPPELERVPGMALIGLLSALRVKDVKNELVEEHQEQPGEGTDREGDLRGPAGGEVRDRLHEEQGP